MVDGRIVIASGDVEGLSGSGESVWHYTPPDAGVPFAPVALADLIAVPVLSGSSAWLVGLQGLTGKKQWQTPLPLHGSDWVWAAADASMIVVLSNGTSPALFAFQPSGRLVWTAPVTSPISIEADSSTPIAVGSGSVVVATSTGLEAHALANGRRTWVWQSPKIYLGPAVINGAPVIVGNQVLADWSRTPIKEAIVGLVLSTGARSFVRATRSPDWFAVNGKTIYTDEREETGATHLAAYSFPGFQLLWRRATGQLNYYAQLPGALLPLAGGVLIATDHAPSSLELDFVGPASNRVWRMPIPHSTDNNFLDDTGAQTTGLVPTGSGVLLSSQPGWLFAFGPVSNR